MEKTSYRIHLNGDPNPCGIVTAGDDDFVEALESFRGTMKGEECINVDDENPSQGFMGYCDRGEDRVPILTDHKKLVPVPDGRLPCRFFTREGVRISSLRQLVDLAEATKQTCDATAHDHCQSQPQIDLYAVSAGRVFMFAPERVGEIFELAHVQTENGLPVYLEVLSVEPRVFDVFNFFTKAESADLVKRALEETSPSHKIKRSTTGTTQYSVFAKRTSESGFDTHGQTAQKIKRRCMSVLGFDEYIEGHTDGLQILRYNTTTAYIPHMDYMKDTTGREPHDYDSARKGGNRFATILLYMSDLREGNGGETVFSEAWPADIPESERANLPSALSALRQSGEATVLRKGSWEEEMVATCRSRLSIRPNSARAVLFYSQHPSGEQDLMSKHGGCPVLEGEKWAANLWAWNTPREGFAGSPIKKDHAKALNGDIPAPGPSQLKATFRNSGKDPAFKEAELYYDESGYWGKLGFGDPPLVAFTYEGHRWNIKVGDKFVKQFVISADKVQKYEI